MGRASFHRWAVKAIRPIARPPVTVLALGVLGLLASCAPPPPPPPAPPPPPRAVQAPVPPAPAAPADWRDAPATPGTWRWSLASGKSVASFANDPAPALVTLTCERAQGLVVLARAVQTAAAEAVPMELTTTSSSHALMSDPGLAAPGWLATPIRAGDPLLDAMAFSRGRFALGAAGQATLYLPSWPEVSRVIEGCR